MATFQSFTKKDFIPGYSGHVPKMQHLFGIPAGRMSTVLKAPGGLRYFITGGGTIKKLRAKSIVGYTGHRTGVRSENMHAKGYARQMRSSLKLNAKRPQKEKRPWLTNHSRAFSADRLNKIRKG